MTQFECLTWILAASSIFGSYLNIKQNRLGFIVWGIANICWLLVDALREIYAQSFVYLVFIGMNIYGWRTWGKNKEADIVHK